MDYNKLSEEFHQLAVKSCELQQQHEHTKQYATYLEGHITSEVVPAMLKMQQTIDKYRAWSPAPIEEAIYKSQLMGVYARVLNPAPQLPGPSTRPTPSVTVELEADTKMAETSLAASMAEFDKSFKNLNHAAMLEHLNTISNKKVFELRDWFAKQGITNLPNAEFSSTGGAVNTTNRNAIVEAITAMLPA